MNILERSVYVGPSLYAHFPVIKLVLDLGSLEAWPTGKLGAGFVDALVAALPTLADHGCSYREPGGFIRRMKEDEGTWLGHVFEHVAIELQNIAGEDVSFGKTRSVDGQPGVYTVVYEYAQRDEGIEAGELAIRLLCSLCLRHSVRPAACPKVGCGAPRVTSSFVMRSAARSGLPRLRW
jgi:cyanophycin synthetase